MITITVTASWVVADTLKTPVSDERVAADQTEAADPVFAG